MSCSCVGELCSIPVTACSGPPLATAADKEILTRIPDLRLDGLSIYIDGACGKLDANS